MARPRAGGGRQRCSAMPLPTMAIFRRFIAAALAGRHWCADVVPVGGAALADVRFEHAHAETCSSSNVMSSGDTTLHAAQPRGQPSARGPTRRRPRSSWGAGCSATGRGPSPGPRCSGSALKRAICASAMASKKMPNGASATPIDIEHAQRYDRRHARPAERRRDDPRQHRLQAEHQVQAPESEVRLVARAHRPGSGRSSAVAPVAQRDVQR